MVVPELLPMDDVCRNVELRESDSGAIGCRCGSISKFWHRGDRELFHSLADVKLGFL